MQDGNQNYASKPEVSESKPPSRSSTNRTDSLSSQQGSTPSQFTPQSSYELDVKECSYCAQLDRYFYDHPQATKRPTVNSIPQPMLQSQDAYMHLLDLWEFEKPYRTHHYSEFYEPLISERIVGSAPSTSMRQAIDMNGPDIFVPIGSYALKAYRMDTDGEPDDSKAAVGEDC